MPRIPLYDPKTAPPLDPTNYGSFGKTPAFRTWMREKLYHKRKGKSDLSGKTLGYGFHMHEALITRKHVPRKHEQWLIYSEYNVLLLRPEEHIPQPPSRDEAYDILVRLYGKETIELWLKNLPLKVLR